MKAALFRDLSKALDSHCEVQPDAQNAFPVLLNPEVELRCSDPQARKSVVGAEVQRGLMGGGCGDGASYAPAKQEEPSVESTGLSFSSFWDWHKVRLQQAQPCQQILFQSSDPNVAAF